MLKRFYNILFLLSLILIPDLSLHVSPVFSQALTGGIEFPSNKFFIGGFSAGEGLGLVFSKERDYILVSSPLTATNVAYLNDTSKQVLINVSGLGGVRDSGNPAQPLILEIYAFNSTLYYFVWFYGSYFSGSVSAGSFVQVPFPDSKFFVVTLINPSSNKSGWIFCFKHGNILVSSSKESPQFVNIGDSNQDILLNLTSLAVVKDSGSSANPYTLFIHSLQGNIDFAIWSRNSYSQGSVKAPNSNSIIFPPGEPFMLAVANPSIGRIGWIFACEKNNFLFYTTLTTTTVANLFDFVKDSLVEVPSIGEITDSGDPNKLYYLNFSSNTEKMYYWIWSSNTYNQRISGNKPPITLVLEHPTAPVNVSEEIVFSFAGFDPDGNVTKYEIAWGDGSPLVTGNLIGNNISKTINHTYSLPATFNITLRVQDNEGAWSEYVVVPVQVVSTANQPPIAFIDSITPNPANVSDTVTFTGHGSDPDGAITGYSWDSNIDGHLSNQAIFSISNLSPGNHTITFKVKDNKGAWSNPVNETLVIRGEAPGFQLLINPPTRVVYQGGNTSYTLTLTPTGSLTIQTVTVTVLNLPSDTYYQVSPPENGTGGSKKIKVNIQAGNTVGNYELTINVSSGDLIRSAPAVLIIQEKPVRDFNIALNKKDIEIVPGESLTLAVSVTSTSGYSNNVTLSCSTPPVNIGVKFNPSQAKPNFNSEMKITVSDSCPSGTYKLMVKATGTDNKIHSCTLTLHVTEKKKHPSTGFDFKLRVEPEEVKIEEGEKTYITVKVSLVKGQPQTIKLEITGLPEDASYKLIPKNLKTGETANLTIKTGTTTGYFLVSIKASGGGVTHKKTIKLMVEKRKCFIATATYGSELSPEVIFLRKFRNRFILSSFIGKNFYRAFNLFYYSFSPYVADFIYKHPQTKPIFKTILYPLIGSLHAAATLTLPIFKINKEIGSITAGLIVSMLLGFTYLGLPLSIHKEWKERKGAEECRSEREKIQLKNKKKLLNKTLLTVTPLLLLTMSEILHNSTLAMISATLLIISFIAFTALTTPHILSYFLGKAPTKQFFQWRRRLKH